MPSETNATTLPAHFWCLACTLPINPHLCAPAGGSRTPLPPPAKQQVANVFSACFSFPCVFPQAAGSLLAYKPGFYHPALLYWHQALPLTVWSPRMPAILDGDEAIRKWLDFAEVPTQEAVKLIQPTENVVFHPVSTFVNSVRNNTPECVAPIELGAQKVRAGGGQLGHGAIPGQGRCCPAAGGQDLGCMSFEGPFPTQTVL